MRLISALKEGFEVDLIYFSWGFDTELCRNFAAIYLMNFTTNKERDSGHFEKRQ